MKWIIKPMEAEMKWFIVSILMFVSIPVNAANLSGVWRVNGKFVAVKQDGSAIDMYMALNGDDTGFVKVHIKGEVLESDGEITIFGVGDHFDIIHDGEKCIVKPSLILGHGYIVGSFPSRAFNVAGRIYWNIFCDGVRVTAFEFNMSGVWR